MITYLTSAFTNPILSSLEYHRQPENINLDRLRRLNLNLEPFFCLALKFLMHMTVKWYNTMMFMLK